MKTLEIRRHTMRLKPGAHLCAQGIALANYVGKGSGPFDLVITSSIPRAIETAIAMGYEVHRKINALGNFPVKAFKETGWPTPFSDLAQILAQKGHAFTFAHKLAMLFSNIADELPEAGKALIVTHGGFVELGALGSLPDTAELLKEEPIGYCEGVQLKYTDNNIVGELLRVPREHYLVEN